MGLTPPSQTSSQVKEFPIRQDNFVHLLCDFSQGKKKKGDEVADDEDDIDAVKTDVSQD